MKFETFISISRQRPIQILIGIGFLYLIFVSMEIPFVFKTGLSQEPNYVRPLRLINSEANLDQREEAPTRPLERVSRKSFQPISSRVPGHRGILSSLVFDQKRFDAGGKDGASELYKSAKMAWEDGKKYWEELESGKLQLVSGTVENRSESCPHSVSLSGSEFMARGQVMVIPCGLTLGSHITLVGKPRVAHEEYDPKISLLKDGDDSVMVSQFKMELQGLKTVEGEDPPRVLHFNPRLKGDWSGRPVIEQNTCYRMQWGSALRCEGWKSKADEETGK